MKKCKKWIQSIGNKLENEFTQLDKNPNKNQSSFMGGHLKHKNYMPIYNCPKDFFPEISKISKTNKLEKIKTKIKNIYLGISLKSNFKNREEYKTK